jgi:CheY-like chemotaxis protein
VKLLIVDDIDSNRKVLRLAFEADGHTTLEASDGVEALHILARETVDAVLSDVLMPRMDGYRLCHEIRTREQLRELPIVIYTSTYTAPGDIELTRSLGADKYLKKPAPYAAVLAAVREAIAMPHSIPSIQARQEIEILKEYSDRLVAKLEQRNIQLAGANERLAILDRAKNDFLVVIAHELRTPLIGLFSVGDLILAGMPSTENNNKLRGVFKRSRQRLLSLVEDVLLLTEIDVNRELFSSVPVALAVVLARAVESAVDMADFRGVKFAFQPMHTGLVVADAPLLTRALHTLLETAVKFAGTGTPIRISHDEDAEISRLILETHGGTISAAALPKFFEVFSIEETLTPGGDLGLGPAVAQRILSLFGASVRVENTEVPGIRLTVSLNKAPFG